MILLIKLVFNFYKLLININYFIKFKILRHNGERKKVKDIIESEKDY